MRILLRCKLWWQVATGVTPVWQGYGELLQQHPFFFHYVMLQAPRWNCHAVLGVLPGFKVARYIRVDIATVHLAARAWTIVVYAQNAGSRIMAVIDPGQAAADDGFLRLDLPPGTYHLGVRYYACQEHAAWPAIHVDGQWVIPSRPLGQEGTVYGHYLDKICGQCPWFYRLVHHHLFVALSDNAEPRPALDRLVLPVGNPNTTFRYGLLPAGTHIQICQEPIFPQNSLVFLTLLNRASLPLYWCQIQDHFFQSPTFCEPTLYLIRIQALASREPCCDALPLP